MRCTLSEGEVAMQASLVMKPCLGRSIVCGCMREQVTHHHFKCLALLT